MFMIVLKNTFMYPSEDQKMKSDSPKWNLGLRLAEKLNYPHVPTFRLDFQDSD